MMFGHHALSRMMMLPFIARSLKRPFTRGPTFTGLMMLSKRRFCASVIWSGYIKRCLSESERGLDFFRRLLLRHERFTQDCSAKSECGLGLFWRLRTEGDYRSTQDRNAKRHAGLDFFRRHHDRHHRSTQGRGAKRHADANLFGCAVNLEHLLDEIANLEVVPHPHAVLTVCRIRFARQVRFGMLSIDADLPLRPRTTLVGHVLVVDRKVGGAPEIRRLSDAVDFLKVWRCRLVERTRVP